MLKIVNIILVCAIVLSSILLVSNYKHNTSQMLIMDEHDRNAVLMKMVLLIGDEKIKTRQESCLGYAEAISFMEKYEGFLGNIPSDYEKFYKEIKISDEACKLQKVEKNKTNLYLEQFPLQEIKGSLKNTQNIIKY